MIKIYCIFLPLLFVFSLSANSTVNVDDYGQLPLIRSMSISPNGKYLSYIYRGDSNDRFIISDAVTKQPLVSANVTKFKARSTNFITDNYVLLRGSDTTRARGYLDWREHTGSLAYNIETGEFKLLLNKAPGLHPSQTGLGKIVGKKKDEDVVYMPGFSDEKHARYNLYKVNLKTGVGSIHARGTRYTVDWFVSDTGKVLAREDFDKDNNTHAIRS